MPTNLYQRSAMALAIAACFPAAGHAAGVARVDFAVGNVVATGPDGRNRPLTRGSEVQVGDTVNTQQGRAQLRFQDGAYMSLQPETAFKIEEFRFAEKGGGNDSIVMNLLKGGMRTITGLIGRANRQNYRLRTEVATIGIRGTEYAVRYTNSIEVFCAGGIISVENEGGTLLLGSGQGGFVQSPNQEPQRTDERPFLPPTEASGTQPTEDQQISPPVNPVQESLTQTLLTGKITGNAAVAHSDFFAPFSEEGAALELNDAGQLVAFDAVEGVALSLGTATPEPLSGSAVPPAGNDGIIAWGRWLGGMPNNIDGSPSGIDLATEGPLHYVVGLPVTNMPTTGLATYNMIGATTPTFDGVIVTSAQLNSSSLAVDFLWQTVSLNFNMTVNGATVQTTGSPFDIMDLQNARFSGGISLSGPFCSQFLDVNGFLAGNGASRAGLAYNLFLFDSGSGKVVGTVAYGQNGIGASSASDPRPSQQ